jgi:hypothetical protein
MMRAIQLLKNEEGQVSLADVLGVMDCCDSWITDRDQTNITKIPTKSQVRRIALCLGEE